MVEDFYIVFSIVSQLQRQSIGRIKYNLDVVNTILVSRTNSRRILLLNRLYELVFFSANKILIKDINTILLEGSFEALPSLAAR